MNKEITLVFLLPAALFILFFITLGAGEAKNLQPGVMSLTPTTAPTHMPLGLREFYTLPKNSSVLVSSVPVRGVVGDFWADVIIGQPNFGQVTPNQVVGNKVFNPGGVLVDRTVVPNRLYVYDAGNSRILGFSSLGSCAAGVNTGLACTSTSDCPGSTCTINSTKPADVILGQQTPNESMCNGDGNFQSYPIFPSPSAETLCGISPEASSILEAGSVATMAVDGQGNLYHPDFFNNRVLRYNNPFSTDRVADFVWGQSDFTHRECNNGTSTPDNKSLCLTGWGRAGVAVDSNGNLWIADTNNHRVLRFPYDSQTGAASSTANLVLGQSGFTTRNGGTGLNQMLNPSAVRVGASGVVYVLDGDDGSGIHGRLLLFSPPLSNGMAASQVFTGIGRYPTGLELDSSGDLWINNSEDHEILRLSGGQITQAIPWVDSGSWGGLGIDRDKAVMTGGWTTQQIHIYRPPSYPYWSDTFLKANFYGAYNELGASGLANAQGLEVTDDQLIVSDGVRLLFWNNPRGLISNYPPADGVIGQPDFFTRPGGAVYGRMRADTQHSKLWVVKGNGDAHILAYQLPLTSVAEPVINIVSPLPLKGGGSFAWTNGLHVTGIAYQPDCDCLWLSDTLYNRVFRVSHINSPAREVDIILGQNSENGIHCNQGRDPDDGYAHPLYPSQDSLCHPGGLALDQHGNLFVSDNNLELAGNRRLLEFDATDIPPNPPTAIKGLPAKRVYGRNGSFTEPECRNSDPMCAPWEPVFSLNNDMVVGFNGYQGSHFPQVYHDPLTNTLPYASLMDFYSHAYSARRDSQGNLYILDLTRSRVLIYKAITHTISGNVGVSGAEITYINEGVKSTTSAADGTYSIRVPDYWSGSVTPSHQFFNFVPANRTYSNVTADQVAQDFTATSLLPSVLSIVRSNNNPTRANRVSFVVTFTKPVAGVDIADFALTTTGLTGAAITDVSGSGAIYTVTVNTGSGNGTIRLDVIDNDSIKDSANNPLGGFGAGNGNFMSGEEYTITKTNGADTTGVFRPSNGLLYLKNKNETGFADLALNYGIASDYPIVGDWDGNGTATIGIYRNGSFYLRNSNTVGFADMVFPFGMPGDQPIAGDWDNDRIDTIGVYRSSTGQFLLRNSNTAGAAEMSFYLGNVGDVGIAGDWNGDGFDTTGVFRPINGIIFLKNTNTTGFADVALNYGIPGDKPVTGDWDNDGIDTIGVYRNGIFMLRNSNDVGFADISFGLGNPGDMPIAGNWDGLP